MLTNGFNIKIALSLRNVNKYIFLNILVLDLINVDKYKPCKKHHWDCYLFVKLYVYIYIYVL
jgi:hypothetical protein